MTTSQEFKIELLSPAATGDGATVPVLTDLVNKVYANAEEGLWNDGMTRTTVPEMASCMKAGEIAAATQDSKIIGCVRVRKLDEQASEFGMLTASFDHRGIGVGRELVRFAEQRARDSGSRTMQLELLVPRGWKHPAKEFLDQWYRRLGYEMTTTASLADFYPELFPLLAIPCECRIYRKDIRIRSGNPPHHPGWPRGA